MIDPAAAWNIKSVLNWVRDEKPLLRKENEFLENAEDFIALADSRGVSLLDLAIRRSLGWCLPRSVRPP